MSKISKIFARQIIDSRANPTVEVDVWLDTGELGRAGVPSGASTGIHEALELRDGDKSDFLGKSVHKAVANVNDVIAPALMGMEIDKQTELDNKMLELDGTENKSKLGANAILGVSLAYAKASAEAKKIPLFKQVAEIYGSKKLSLPRPMFNIMNGGRHANWSTDIQEFMVIIQNKEYPEMLRACCEIFLHMGKLLEEKGMSVNIGNEGGYAPGFKNNEEAFNVISEAVEKSGYKLGEEVFFGMDVASSEFYDADKGTYTLKTENRELGKEDWSATLDSWIGKYPFLSIEDPYSQDDWEMWTRFTEKYGSKYQIVGDDLLVTNVKRIEKGISEKACNSLLVKVNQIGSLTETFNAMKMSEQAGWTNVVSHRSGETEDVTISHIVVGTGAGQIKTGAPSRGERTAKYNELLRIGELL
jgi:enolase